MKKLTLILSAIAFIVAIIIFSIAIIQKNRMKNLESNASNRFEKIILEGQII